MAASYKAPPTSSLSARAKTRTHGVSHEVAHIHDTQIQIHAHGRAESRSGCRADLARQVRRFCEAQVLCEDGRADEEKHDEDDDALRPSHLRVAEPTYALQIELGRSEQAEVEESHLLQCDCLQHCHAAEREEHRARVCVLPGEELRAVVVVNEPREQVEMVHHVQAEERPTESGYPERELAGADEREARREQHQWRRDHVVDV
mmetsp:Transcript_42868/g.91517  ORF Transcript_42868/g.91517 Transcript_42868/m.91517 type:complete len:204 (-) Transcript_42868:584-1195(-)